MQDFIVNLTTRILGANSLESESKRKLRFNNWYFQLDVAYSHALPSVPKPFNMVLTEILQRQKPMGSKLQGQRRQQWDLESKKDRAKW